MLGNIAWGFILALGIIAALDELRIAENVVNSVLYAALAALVGIAVVAVGGGGIKTMSQRWEATAARYDAEKARLATARTTPGIGGQAGQAAPGGSAGSYGATAAPTQPAEPYHRPDDGDDQPTDPGSTTS